MHLRYPERMELTIPPGPPEKKLPQRRSDKQTVSDCHLMQRQSIPPLASKLCQTL